MFLTITTDKFYFNAEQKKVILYIDKPLGNLSQSNIEKLDNIKKLGVTVVNSLEELRKWLSDGEFGFYFNRTRKIYT